MGGRVTKCFTVNLFFARCRQSLTGIYTLDIVFLTHKKRFCEKGSPRCEKMSPKSKLDF